MSLSFSPQFIVQQLDRYVVGQDRAKRDLAILGFYQAIRQQMDKKEYEDFIENLWEQENPQSDGEPELKVQYSADGSVNSYNLTEPKSKQIAKLMRDNRVRDRLRDLDPCLPGKAGLILGPSGCGKTYLVSLLGKVLDLPVIYVNAMELTNTGYVGRTIADICDDALHRFIASGKYDEWQLPYSIIFVDEFDKRCVAAEERSWDKQIQYSLLAGLEGKKITDSSSKGSAEVETSRMLWILGGSFQHLRDMKSKESKTIGYTGSVEPSESDFHVYSAADLETGGIIKEIAGRLPVVTEVMTLTREQMRAALAKENSTLKPYIDMYAFLGREFNPTDAQVDMIIDKCQESKTGARGLSYAIHEVFKDDLMTLEYRIE